MDNKNKHLVSVIFTSYNHKEYLKQAIDSIVNQTYSNLEIIVVDDCSTDGSQEILLQYKDNTNVKLHLLEKNSGSYVRSSNYGAKLATGQYLLFAQCDDYAEPDQIEKLMNAFSKNDDIGVVYSRSNLVDGQDNFICDDFTGREKSFRDKCKTDTYISGPEMREFLSFACVIPNLSAAIIKTDLYFKSGGLPERFIVMADWALWLNLSEITGFYYLTECLNNFRQHQTTIRSEIKFLTQLNELYTIFYEHYKTYKLNASQRRKLKIGAGSVWASYFIDNTKGAVLSLPSVSKKLWAFDKFNLVYLASGGLKIIKEVVIKRISK